LTKAAAARQRRHRARQRNGVLLVQLEVSEDITAALVQADLIAEHELENRCAIAKAVSALLRAWAAKVMA
jgi:hypothetical protein